MRPMTRREMIEKWEALTPQARYALAKPYLDRQWFGHIGSINFFGGRTTDEVAKIWATTPFSELPYGWEAEILGMLKTIGKYKLER